MNIINFISESLIILAIFVIIYQTLLRKLVHFNLNRFYLLVAVSISVIVPFVSIPVNNVHQVSLITLPKIVIVPEETDNLSTIINGKQILSFKEVVMSIYVLGVILSWVRLFWISIALYLKLRTYKPVRKLYGIKIFQWNQSTDSFSFFNLIFLGKTDDPKTKHMVLKHEWMHVKKRHSFDKLFIELLQTFVWFNPFVWIAKRELLMIHEFQADKSNDDHIDYMQLLIKLNINKTQFFHVNQFNKSFLKRRFKMLTRKNQSKKSVIMVFTAFTVAISTVFIIACNDENQTLKKSAEKAEQEKNAEDVYAPDKQPSDPIEDEIFTVVEEKPEYPGGFDELSAFISNNINYPESAKDNNIEGTTYIQFIVKKDGNVDSVKILKGFHEACDQEALRVVRLMDKWKPAYEKGKPVNVKFNLPVKFSIGEK